MNGWLAKGADYIISIVSEHAFSMEEREFKFSNQDKKDYRTLTTRAERLSVEPDSWAEKMMFLARAPGVRARFK